MPVNHYDYNDSTFLRILMLWNFGVSAEVITKL